MGSLRGKSFKGENAYFTQIDNIIGFETTMAHVGAFYNAAEKQSLNPSDEHLDISLDLLLENVRLFPESALSYGFLGRLYQKKKRYKLALEYLRKAQELNFTKWDLEKKH